MFARGGRLLLLLALVVVGEVRAHAGIVKDYIDVVYVTPFVGLEIGRMGYAGVNSASTTTAPGIKSGSFVFDGLAYGGGAGFRIGGLSIGAIYQRTQADGPNAGSSLNLNKLYGEVGINIRTSFIMTIIHFDFGWAFFGQDGLSRQDGLGGKVGIALEFYPVRILSLGVGADFDAQGFFPSGSSAIGTYGGTFLARVGLHL